MSEIKRRFHPPGSLIPGRVHPGHFRLLAAVCTIRNKSMRDALEDVLVNGLSCREACRRHGVTQSHLSVKYNHMQTVSQTVALMYSFGPLSTPEEGDSAT